MESKRSGDEMEMEGERLKRPRLMSTTIYNDSTRNFDFLPPEIQDHVVSFIGAAPERVLTEQDFISVKAMGHDFSLMDAKAGEEELNDENVKKFPCLFAAGQKIYVDLSSFRYLFIPKGVKILALNGKYIEATNLFIPSSVERIEENCFYLNAGIRTVRFQKKSNLTYIGARAFFHCYKLSSIIPAIPASVEEIGEMAFEATVFLEFVIFEAESRLQTIDEFAFQRSGIKEITIPASVQEIGLGAFSKSKLQRVYFEADSKLQAIKRHAFAFTDIKEIAIPASVETIGEFAFQHSGIKEITIPASVQEIGRGAFSKSKLQRVYFEKDSKLRTIDDIAFRECPIEEITLPASVQEIGLGAFSETTRVTRERISPPNNQESIPLIRADY